MFYYFLQDQENEELVNFWYYYNKRKNIIGEIQTRNRVNDKHTILLHITEEQILN